jgi:hypothetical protein
MRRTSVYHLETDKPNLPSSDLHWTLFYSWRVCGSLVDQLQQYNTKYVYISLYTSLIDIKWLVDWKTKVKCLFWVWTPTSIISFFNSWNMLLFWMQTISPWWKTKRWWITRLQNQYSFKKNLGVSDYFLYWQQTYKICTGKLNYLFLKTKYLGVSDYFLYWKQTYKICIGKLNYLFNWYRDTP